MVTRLSFLSNRGNHGLIPGSIVCGFLVSTLLLLCFQDDDIITSVSSLRVGTTFVTVRRQGRRQGRVNSSSSSIHDHDKTAISDTLTSSESSSEAPMRKRRRRKKDSFEKLQSNKSAQSLNNRNDFNDNLDNNLNDNLNDNLDNDDDDDDEDGEALHSMTFQRYRIHLSSTDDKRNSSSQAAGGGGTGRGDNGESEQRRKRRVQRGLITKHTKLTTPSSSSSSDDKRGIISNGAHNQSNDSKPPWKFMNDMVNTVTHSMANTFSSTNVAAPTKLTDSKLRQIEAMCQKFEMQQQHQDKNTKDNQFYFRVADYVETGYGKEDKAFGSFDEDFVSAAAFWRMSSDIASSSSSSSSPNSSFSYPRRCYLALPATTPSIARQLCDILNWFADWMDKEVQFVNQRSETIIKENTVVPKPNEFNGINDILLIRARVVDDLASSPVPVVVFTTSSTPLLQSTADDNTACCATMSSAKVTSSLSNAKLTRQMTERHTKSWVDRLLVKLKICPFTKSNVKSGQGLSDMGVPVSNIMYAHSDAAGPNEVYTLMADAWQSISDMIRAGPNGKYGVSSILLSAPGYDDDFALWAGPIFAMLEAGVGALQAEEMIGVVCFHPRYVTPDGKSWPGFGHMHSLPRLKKWYNQHSSLSPITPITPLTDDEIAAGGAYQRRTPHSVINVLRAEQLEAAEGRRSTGELYARNIRTLVQDVGLDKLKQDLEMERGRDQGLV